MITRVPTPNMSTSGDALLAGQQPSVGKQALDVVDLCSTRDVGKDPKSRLLNPRKIHTINPNIRV